MAKRRRAVRSGTAPRWLTGAGVVVLLSAAVAVGVLVGSRASRHDIAAPAASAPTAPAPQPAKETVPPADTRPRSRPLPRSEPAVKPPVESDAASSRSSHQRRPAAFPGETAFVRDAGSRIALTFDAGASAAPTPDLLDALASAGLRATFFLTGKWCERNPDLVKRIAAEGHEIANHTYSHKDLRKLTDEQIKAQLADMNDVVVRLTGRDTAPYFRPPYGARDQRVLKVAADAGYSSIYWSVDSWDAFKTGITADEISNRVLEKARAGDIVLMHCGSRPTADALPGIIEELRDRGLEIVTVSELLKH